MRTTLEELTRFNPLSVPWYRVKNGDQIDIHCRNIHESREVTVACNVREDCASTLARASELNEQLSRLIDEATALQQAAVTLIRYKNQQQESLWNNLSNAANRVGSQLQAACYAANVITLL